MRKIHRYKKLSGILFILSIIDFALAAPVLVQEKRQACVDMVHIPRDVMAVLGKRGSEQLDKFAHLAEAHFKTLENPVEVSDTHASSSSVPPRPDHGSTNVVQVPVPDPALSDAHASSSSAAPGPDHGTNVVQAPAPNPASPTANPNPSIEPSSPSSSETSLSDDSEELEWLYDLDEEVGRHPHEPNPKKRPWTDLHSNLNPDLKSNSWMNFMNRLPPRPGVRPADGWTDLRQPLPSIPESLSPLSSPDHAPPNPGSLTETGYESMKGDALPGPSGPVSTTMSSADHELMAHALPNPGPSTESDQEVMDVPLSSPGSLTNPDHQSMGTDSPSGKLRKTGKGLWFTTRD